MGCCHMGPSLWDTFPYIYGYNSFTFVIMYEAYRVNMLYGSKTPRTPLHITGQPQLSMNTHIVFMWPRNQWPWKQYTWKSEWLKEDGDVRRLSYFMPYLFTFTSTSTLGASYISLLSLKFHRPCSEDIYI